MPKIDIAIPCYQYGRFLRDCVTSVQLQYIDDLRILIIDNASTDNSVEVAQELARDDPRIEIIAHRTNLGPHASYNEAIDWASSKYFLLTDADDVLLPGWLNSSITCLEQNPNVAFVRGAELFLQDCERMHQIKPNQNIAPEWRFTPGIQFIKQFLKFPSFNAAANTVVRRTSIQKKAGYYKSSLKHTSDVELWLRLALHGDVASTQTFGMIRRIHENQISTRYQNLMSILFQEFETVIDEFFSDNGNKMYDSNYLYRQGKKNLRSRAVLSATARYFRGNTEDSVAIANWIRSKYGIRGFLPGAQILFCHPYIRSRFSRDV
jgi:glycosyltransferase involved in cell wall biosynthesis